MADKLDMKSMNITQENIRKIQALFPNVVTEVMVDGKVQLAVDFDALREELSIVIVEGKQERYQFTWPEKGKAKLLAAKQITSTLRPCVEESVNFDTTKNLYIEGDNLDVLKLLQETYLGKVKMIYIDPPYNTGNNILYRNDFSMALMDYREINGETDGFGGRYFENRESNGRFHTDWLNIIYPRIRLSRDLLSNDGIIVVAIDDNELFNIKKVLDEVFSETNFIGTIVTRCNPQGRGKINIDPVHEYHLIYAKNAFDMPDLHIRKDDGTKEYGLLLRSGTNSRRTERPLRYYPILFKDGQLSMITKKEYENIYIKQKAFDEDYINELTLQYESQGYRVIFPISKDGEKKVWQRQFDRVINEIDTYIYEKGQIKVPLDNFRTPQSLWVQEKYSNVAYGANALKDLFGTSRAPFDFSKSIFTMCDLLSLNTSNSDIILDFFSGSSTTAHATLQLNALDGGHRRFIMVQLPEKCSESSDAYSLGYRIIPDIAKDRIRYAGKKIIEENPLLTKNLDIGFRVLKLDSSNMQDVYYNPAKMPQSLLDMTVDNIKSDRTALDLLFQVMLSLGIELSAKIEEKQIAGKTYYVVNENEVVAFFDEDINNDVITAIAKMQPIYAVFKDKSFASDSVGINNEQLFKTYSPSTIVKVI